MEIIIGKTAGFCYGVKNAVESAKKDVGTLGSPLYCLGELVHNPRVIKDLEERGVIFIDDITKANNRAMIRAHGVPKEVYELAEQNKIELKDYTCPNVLIIHNLAKEYADAGYFIILFGAKDHPENLGTISFCGQDSAICETAQDLNDVLDYIDVNHIKRVFAFSQTTFSIETFDKFKKTLKRKLGKDVFFIIENTICRSTEIRQKETMELSKKCDAMIIIGGKSSSNTKKLYEIAKANCHNTITVEDASEIIKDNYKNIKILGIMAGASTPKESIKDVYNLFVNSNN